MVGLGATPQRPTQQQKQSRPRVASSTSMLAKAGIPKGRSPFGRVWGNAPTSYTATKAKPPKGGEQHKLKIQTMRHALCWRCRFLFAYFADHGANACACHSLAEHRTKNVLLVFQPSFPYLNPLLISQSPKICHVHTPITKENPTENW